MEKLYNELFKQGKYTKSFEEFKSQFGSEDGQKKLHGALSESGDYTKSLGDFSTQFFSENEVKIEDGAVGASAPSMGPVEAPEPTVLTLEDTFSELPEEIEVEPQAKVDVKKPKRYRNFQERMDAVGLAEAKELFPKISKAQASITEEQITEKLAKDYFNLSARPYETVIDTDAPMSIRGGGFGGASEMPRTRKEYQSIEDYLGPDKYEQYQQYQETGELISDGTSENQAVLQQGRSQARYDLSDQIAKLELRNVSENAQRFFGDVPINTVDQAEEYLDFQKNNIKSMAAQNKEQYASYQAEAKELEKRFNDVQRGIDEIGEVDSEEKRLLYNELVTEGNAINAEYTDAKFEERYNSIVKQQQLINSEFETFKKKTTELSDRKVLEKAASLDYSFSAKAGMAMEEFFVKELYHNFGTLLKEVGMRGVEKLTQKKPGEYEARFDDAIAVMRQSNQNYNLKIAKKREDNIPESLKLDDIGNNNVGFFDWFTEAFADNSPSIITTFIPGGAAVKTGMAVKSAAKIGTFAARKAALASQRAWGTVATRTAQGVFFGGGTGGKFGDIELTEANAKLQLVKLRSMMEGTEDLSKKKELQDEIDELERVSSFSLTQKAFTSFGFGTTEMFAESLSSLKLVTGASRIAKSMGKREFKAEIYGKPINFAANVTGGVVSGLSPLVKGGTTELLEETVTQVAHNAIDIIVLGENKSLIEGLDKDFVANVLVTSGGIMAPKTAGNVVNILKNEFRIKSELKANQELTVELVNLSSATSNMSKAEQVAARARKSEIIEKLGLSDAISLHKLRYMTPEQIEKAADLSRQAREVGRELYRLGSSGEGFTTTEGQRAKARLQDQLDNILDQKEFLLSAKDRVLRKQMSDFFKANDGKIQNKNGEFEYYSGLFEFYQDTAMSLMPKNGKYISVKDINNLESDLAGFSKEAIATVKAGFESGSRASIIDDSIIINEEAVKQGLALANNFVDGKYAAIAPLEELFHIYNIKNGVTKGGKLDKMSIAAVDEAIEVLKEKKELGKISDKEYNNLIARFELYKEGGRGKVVLKSGKRGGAKVDSEEVLAQINNAIALGVFNREDISNIPSLRGFINGISNSIFGDSSWMFNLKTAEDVFKFAENFQKSIKDGVAIDSSSEEEEIIKNSMSTAQDLNWEQTDEALVADFKVGDRNYKTTLEETAFMEFDEGQTYQDIEDIANDLGITEDAEGDSIESSEKFYHLEFGDTELGKGITGEGNAFEVFSTAINGVSDYLKNNSDVEGVVFTAKEPSRIRLYKTLGKVLADKIGGSFGFKNDTFIVAAKKPKQESQVKFSLSANDSAKVNELYETKGDAALMDVVDLMTPTAKGLTENFRNRPKYSEFKDQLQDEILNGKRGIMETIMGYPAYVKKQEAEGKAVAPLSGYLNNSFSTKTGFKRYIEIADRVLGKDEQSQFTQEINNESLNIASDEDIDISDFSSEISQSTINALKAAGLSTVESVLDQDIASIVKQTKLDARVIKDAVDVFREELDVRSGSKQLDTKERESLRKKIELTPEVTQKVRDAVAKTFGTKLPDIDSRDFKMALQKAFRTELKTTMAKDVMGSRAAFETFLRDNFETIFEVIPQGVMNKRFKAFIEPVLDSSGKQKREKTAVGKPIFKKKPIVKAEFIKYFLGLDVGTSTKGTRKDALAEALAEEFAFDATMETIQTEDVATKREFLDKGQTTEKVSKKIGRPSTMKFNKAVAFDNLFQKLPFEKTKDDFNTLNGFRWGSILQATLAGSGVSAINMKTTEGRQRFKDYAVSSGLISILPKSFWRSMQGSTENLLKDTTKKSGEDVKETRKLVESLRKDPSIVTDKEFDKQFRDYTGNLPFKSVEEVNEWISETEANGGTFAKESQVFSDMLKKENPRAKKLPMEKALNDPAFVKRQENSINGLKKVFEIFQDTMKDPEGIAFVAALMSSSGASQNHFIRKSAPWKFYQKSYLKESIREEHTLPASLIGKYLFMSALGGTVSSDFVNVKKNFFQGALSKVNDDKLKGEKLNGEKFDYVESTPEGWKITDNIWARYFNVNVGLNAGGINPSDLILADNKSVYDIHNVTSTGVKVDAKAKFSRSVANELSGSLVPSSIKYSKPVTTQTLINALAKTDKALELARKLDQPVRKIRVFDFDDTLARTKSNVLYTMPDGTTGKIDAATFAKEAGRMEAEGAQWDFSEFSKVMQGSKGPLLDVAKIIADKRGTKDVFVLTARPADAAGPIKEFLASMGLDIPLANITGLGDGAPQAKAGWIMGKAAEGYNDFYFADDHTGNVKAVKDVLSQIDVKSKVQLAKFSKSATFDTIVNDMIEDSSGIETYKKYSAAKAKTVGASKGKYNFLIPPSAEDFTGLLYKMLGKGKKGDAQMAFLKANLLDPYNRAESAVTQAKIAAANDFKALKNQLKTLPKTLSKQTGIGKFTYSQAVRVAAWTRQGMEVPGLSKRDVKELNDFVTNDSKLNEFTNELIVIQKGKQYPKPTKDWLGGNITTDIIGDINKVNRAEYQQEWRENIDIIFSKENMNKMEAAYGTRWREAMEDSIRRMKSGSNKPIGGNKVTEGLLSWLNNSVGAVMFLNTRSALLQTISAVNFINLSDNNIVKAGAAFANQKQFWGDFMTLMNSDYLVERRNGLKINVSESEIADAVRESKNKPKAAIAFLLSKGFVMTRFADSFAIASGGSTFYRNRLKSLLKSGMDQKAAEAQAFADFKAIAEESQQSSSPSKISQQQASAAGRVILAWANTPMQYARIQKRAAQDLINGRGDWKTNVSKIVYYGAVQNLIFNTLQQAVFALGFGDDDEDDDKKAEKKNKKAFSVANGMIDSQLRGLGIFGAASAAMKNTLITLYEQHGKKSPKYDEAVADLLSFSPPLGSKVSKVKGGFRSFSWNRKEIESKGFSLDNPAYLAGAQIVTGFTNVPLDRVAKKINNIRGIYSEKSALWQKVALGLGWSTWDVDLGYYGGFDEEVEKKKVSEMTKEEKREYRKQKEAERAKIRKQREFERERRRIERNK